MFDIGWMELLVIGVVALIVVGPEDLPGLFRNAGRFVGRLRGMAHDFQSAMEQAADEADLKGAADTVKKAANVGDVMRDPLKAATKSAKNYAKDLDKEFEDIEKDISSTPSSPDQETNKNG